MARRILLGCVMIMVSQAFAQERVDSMDLGDNSMEWRSFVTDEPAGAFAESKGNLWYATPTSVGFYSVKTNAKSVVTSLGSLPAQGVTDMAVDRRGGIWFATPQGVAYTADGHTFSVFSKKDGLVDNAVNRLYVADDAAVWAGTAKGASAYANGAWKSYTTAEGLCGNQVRDIAGNKTSVFFATNAGLGMYTRGQWKKFDRSSGMVSNDVKAVAWDPRKEEVWAAVGESDVNTYNGKKWNDFMDVQEGITCIMVDTQSRVWVGSSTGLIKYNGFEWIYDPAKMPFPATECSRMYRDQGGNLWFAINTGIMRLKNPYPY
jgi:ligand-binding sensor domain-containing protein